MGINCFLATIKCMGITLGLLAVGSVKYHPLIAAAQVEMDMFSTEKCTKPSWLPITEVTFAAGSR